MYIYIRRLFSNDANGNQISFKKEVAEHFFNAPEEFMKKEKNFSIHIFHFNNTTSFADIELQPATDFRFSTTLNTFLSNNGQTIAVDDLLYVEKVGKGYGVKLIKPSDSSYSTFRALLDENDRHFLLCTDDEENPTSDDSDTDNHESDSYVDEVLKLLQENLNLVLTGAPGTGKTYLAKQLAAKLVGNCKWKELTGAQKEQISFVQFHPSFDYTDFVEGLRPDEQGNFVRTNGDFKELCRKAASDPGKYPHVMVIDEINRGEISKIFGELFYSIEKDYRGDETRVRTQYNNMVKDGDIFKAGFYVPENVYIIGTMNDIDRGVEAMDFAIRRRFAWREVTAEESAANMGITGTALLKMNAINKAILASELNEAYCIGGAYFRNVKNNDFDALWKFHLRGIVTEYFRGEPEITSKVNAIEEAYKNATEDNLKNQSDNTENAEQ